MAILQNSNAITPAADGFELKSLRFNEADSAALYRTNVIGGNRKTATWSVWVKPEAFSTSNRFMFMCLDGTIGNAGNEFAMTFPSNDCLELSYYPSGSYTMRLVTNQVFRDPSAWYHILCNIDTTQDTSSNRAKIYVNGSQVTSFSTETYMAQNSDTSVNKVSMDHWIGRSNGNDYFPGYLAEYYFLDGAQLTPAYFGETNEDTNQWQPKNPTDVKSTLTFGTNGFYLPFSNDALAASFTDSSDGFIPTENLIIDAMLVGGGGGGAHAQSGGAGGGGMITLDSFPVSVKSYGIVIGAGGLAANDTGYVGGSTTAFGETATGGGGGGIVPGAGGAGANGGGGADYAPPQGAGGVGTAPSVVSSLATAFGGFNGGPGGTAHGGGGGGLTAAGGAGVAYNRGGTGGAGKQYNLDGNNY